MRRSSRGNKQIVTARTGTRRFFQDLDWALTLALRLGGLLRSGLLRLPPLTHPLAIPATLPATALAATFRLPPCLARTPIPPPLGRLLARRTAVPRLRPPRLKELLAPLQQTAAPPWPLTRTLPRTRSSIIMELTQGSAHSRRSSPGEEPLLLSRTLYSCCFIPRPPLFQTNCPHPRPPVPVR